MKILGIDDNENINKMLDDVMTQAGHDFKSVNNGRDGLKLIREQKWDAVLLDVAMPNFSGKDVVNELVKDGNIKKQPVILFTALSLDTKEVNEMIKQGVYSCITKPANMENLLEVLENLKDT
ncbi:MAG: response regulator [Thaumarchaeota archaeon]|nr:response regulator [Nitrososphaerota archaeon]